MPLGTFVIHGKRKNMNIKGEFGRSFFQLSWMISRVQDFSGGSKHRCGGNSRELELEVDPEGGEYAIKQHCPLQRNHS